MDRFEYIDARLNDNESFVVKEKNIKLYDGDNKTPFEDGEVVLTTHRLFWGRPGEIAQGMRCLCLRLEFVFDIDEEMASSNFFGKKKRLILKLKQIDKSKKLPGPRDDSREQFIKLSSKSGIEESLINSFRETLEAKVWAINEKEEEKSPRIQLRTGIVGIERNLKEKQKQTDETITVAFQDLNKLMVMAQDMVQVSKSISAKIKERQGDISDDETVKFKAYLLSLGIDDPVTRDNYTSSSEYYDKLAKQLTEFLMEPILEAGGMMALTDVYCRVNRARGMELLSPEDLLNACHRMFGPIKLRTFPSGAMVLQTETHDDVKIIEEISEELEKCTSISSEELAQKFHISLMLSMERLLTAERAGTICRDESVEGLRFYINRFL